MSWRDFDFNYSKKPREITTMPAVSKKQRRAIAIAEHRPDELYARNKSLKKMKKSDMHDFAATSEKKLPTKIKKKGKK